MLFRAFFTIMLAFCMLFPPNAFAAGVKKHGGTLICSFSGEAGTLDPADAIDPASVNIKSAIFEGLVHLSPDGKKIMPALAKRWYTKDFKIWTFELKNNIKFHDGTDFTSNAVKFSLERLISNKSTVSSLDSAEYFRELVAGKGSKILKIELPESNKVRISLSEPDINFLRKLAVPSAFIVSPYSVKQFESGSVTCLAGTGPYRFSDRRKPGRIVLARNLAYGGFIYSDSLIFESSSEFSSSIRNMIRGNTDMILGVSNTNLDSLDTESKLLKECSDENIFFSLLLNPTKKEFSISSRRRAVSALINRKDLAVSFGFREAYSFLMPCHDEFVKKNFSFNMADIAEFSECISKGRVFDLIYDEGDGVFSEMNKNIAYCIQNYMRAGGIRVSVRGLSSYDYRNALNSRTYDMAIRSRCDYSLCADAHMLSLRSLSSFRKSCYVKSPWLDDFYSVLKEARKNSSIKERKKLYGNADKILLKNMPEIPLCTGRQNSIISSSVIGANCSSFGIFRFENISVSR